VTERGFWGLSANLKASTVVAAPVLCSKTDEEVLLDGGGAVLDVGGCGGRRSSTPASDPNSWLEAGHPLLQRRQLRPMQRLGHERDLLWHKEHVFPRLWLGQGESEVSKLREKQGIRHTVLAEAA
jgi:hypothetical protein